MTNEIQTRTVTILGLTIEATLAPGEAPRIEAEDVGRLLGYERPRKVRELARRLLDEGRLRPVDALDGQLRPTAGRPAETLWLTERGALLLAMASETERAWHVQEALVDFYLAERRRPLADLEAENERLRTDLGQAMRIIVQRVPGAERVFLDTLERMTPAAPTPGQAAFNDLLGMLPDGSMFGVPKK